MWWKGKEIRNPSVPPPTAPAEIIPDQAPCKKNDVAEECRFAYKDIEQVMAQQLDIVTPVRKLKTVGVVKG